MREKTGTGYFSRARRRARYRAGLKSSLSLFFLAAGCTCDPLAQNGTALRMRVNIDDSVDVTQLRFSASLDGGALFQPVVRPESAGARLESGGSLLALLPDALDKQVVECHVEGLSDAMPVAEDTGTAVVKRGYETTCTLVLLITQPCNPSTCAGCCVGNICVEGNEDSACGTGAVTCRICAVGQRCNQGRCECDQTSCSGCCSGSTCVDGGADYACGRSGAQCSACPVGQTCTGGACGCDGGPCGTGCNSTTCATGCCSAGTCVMPTQASCGTMGFSCVDCRTSLADRCLNGACSCGPAGAACVAGQHCVGGSCVCDNTVCSGCCTNNGLCEAVPSKQRCGLDGGTCRNCTGSQMCTDGQCQ